MDTTNSRDESVNKESRSKSSTLQLILIVVLTLSQFISIGFSIYLFVNLIQLKNLYQDINTAKDSSGNSKDPKKGGDNNNETIANASKPLDYTIEVLERTPIWQPFAIDIKSPIKAYFEVPLEFSNGGGEERDNCGDLFGGIPELKFRFSGPEAYNTEFFFNTCFLGKESTKREPLEKYYLETADNKKVTVAIYNHLSSENKYWVEISEPETYYGGDPAKLFIQGEPYTDGIDDYKETIKLIIASMRYE